MSTGWAVPRIALLMAHGYDPVQAAWIARTARRNPGVPVAFAGSGVGGVLTEQVTYTTDGLWEIRAAS